MAESVHKVDYTGTPEMKELAERARQVGDLMYPKILALLSDETSKLPRKFDVIFEKELKYVGQTLGTKIHLDANWFSKNPTNLDMVLVHEMAHVAQQYKSKVPFYWREGIADYVRYKLDYTNGWSEPQCSAEYPHYSSGFWCTGAFLLYVDSVYGSNVIHQLNIELRRGSFSDKFFDKVVGKSLDELWVEFQKTPYFTPDAAEVNKLHQALGYVNGKPPKDIDTRAEAYVNYVKQRPGFALSLDAAEFLKGLKERGHLPGFLKGERGELSFGLSADEYSETYPASRTFYVQKDGDDSIFHYFVVRPSKDKPWYLQKAWRAGPGGSVLEEYPAE